jgi:peroxiredoxin Q/BCP
MSIEAGDQAPDFTLEADDGTRFRLSEQRGKRLLLVFYPGDDTPVCTRQLCDYRDGAEDFRDLGVEVIGISPDGRESHTAFRSKHALPFRLLADPGLAVAEAWGAKGLLGMKRALFLLDETGVVRWCHIETVALFRRQREDVLAAIRALGDA